MPKSFWDSFVRTASDAMNSQARARIQQAKADTAIFDWFIKHVFDGETQTWRDKGTGDIVAPPSHQFGVNLGSRGTRGTMLELDSDIARPTRVPATGHVRDKYTREDGTEVELDFDDSSSGRNRLVEHLYSLYGDAATGRRADVERIGDAIFSGKSMSRTPAYSERGNARLLQRRLADNLASAIAGRPAKSRKVVPRARRRVVDDSDGDEPFDQPPAKRPPERRLDPPVAEEEDAPLLARVKGILDARRPSEPSRGRNPADDGAVHEVSSSATRVKVEVPRVPPRPSRASAVAPDAPPIPPRSGRGSVDQGVLEPLPPLESDLHEPRISDVKEDEDPVDDQDEVFDDDPDHLVFQGEVDALIRELQDYEERREREENDFVRPPRPSTPVVPRLDPDIGHDPFGDPDPLPRAFPNLELRRPHPKDEEPAEIEVNDAPGAPPMDPWDFDVQPRTSVMGPIGGVDLFNDYALLGEDRYEVRERRRTDVFLSC